MFTIKIAHRIKPYSHHKPTKCLIPRSVFSAHIVPGMLTLQNELTKRRVLIRILVKGPIEQFTVEINPKRNQVMVSMHTDKGVARYSLYRDANDIILKVEKAPRGGLKLRFNDVEQGHSKREEVILAKDQSVMPEPHRERLFLGSTKAQNIEAISWRNDMKEVLPLLFAMSQKVPQIESEKEKGGVYELLKPLGNLKKGHEEAWADLFHAGFESLLAPRANDTDYQGLTKRESEDSALPMLVQLKSLILSMFIEVSGSTVEVLPNLPKSFVSGKLIGIETSFGMIDLEWTKRKIRRMAIYATCEEKVTLKFPPNLISYSVSEGRGFKEVIRKASSPLRVIAKTNYYLTNFKK